MRTKIQNKKDQSKSWWKDRKGIHRKIIDLSRQFTKVMKFYEKKNQKKEIYETQRNWK